MQQHSINDITRTILVTPCVAGIHLDYSLGEELPLFGPPSESPLTYGVGYNSGPTRQVMGMPYFETAHTSYTHWHCMMRRVYDSDAPAYRGCTVCRKWHDYQEYAAWYSVQPYAFEPDAEVDKDILDPLNTVYSPEYCSVVPKVINRVFRNTRSQRGKLPIGVYPVSRSVGVISVISMFGKRVQLGKRCQNIGEAFGRHQEAHTHYCNELADRYESLIDARVISVLRNYSRHIRD